MKKILEGIFYPGEKVKKLLIMTKFCLFFVVLSLQLQANVYSQQERISLKYNHISVHKLFIEIEKITDYSFVYKYTDVSELKDLCVDFNNTKVAEIIEFCLKGTDLSYSLINNHIVIKKTYDKNDDKKKEIKGKVVDEKGNPLPGVTLILKGTQVGTATNTNGEFTLIGDIGDVIVASFIGMQTKEVKIKELNNIKIILEEETENLQEVIVSSFFKRNKESFTGSVKTIKSEEIKSLSNNNVLEAVAMLTPGLKLMENNEFGSDPNRLPDIVVRGTSSLATEADQAANNPIIILDGVEISLKDLYDLDINDIDKVSVLKDASATSLYGERASNGVIIIERKPILNNKLQFRYTIDGTIDLPDLNSYDYLNATEKLEFERLAGLYDFSKLADFEEYNRKRILISQGLDTDWLSKPLRTGFTLNNSVGVSGKGGDMTYRVNANIKNINGVMKDDYRNTNGLSLYLSYHVNKLTVSFQSSYSNLKFKNSPYGTFSDYVKCNPYDAVYNQFERLNKILSYEIPNPLYEAECGNYSKGKSQTFLNNLNLRWDIKSGIYLTVLGSINKVNGENEIYVSPNSTQFIGASSIEDKGSLNMSYNESLNYSGNFVFNFNRTFDDNLIGIHIGGDIYKNKHINNSYTAVGFYKPNLHTPHFAAKYLDGSHPQGYDELDTRLGLFANLNFMYKNKYFVDGSFRRSGSSKFGKNNKYAPFWSVGCGWNIHKEEFAIRDWIQSLRIRYSYGVTGSVAFSPYQAITTYLYNSDYYYYDGIGCIPRTIGNKDLTWQSTYMHNIGLNGDFFKNRFSITLDYYINTTEDMLIDYTIPPSVGETTLKHNLGRMRNRGFEFDITSNIINYKDFKLNLRLNGAHNSNKILSISNALDKFNKESGIAETISPKLLYKEGQSTSAIYAVRSAGINPATGEEVFIKKDGTYTLEYDSNDKVVVGDLEPDLEGTIYSSISYKNLTLNLGVRYKFGGQIYNATRAANVENVNPKYNVDKRAFDQRWKNINDVVPYLDIANADSRTFIHTSRFVEDQNYLEVSRIDLSYQVNSEIATKLGFKRLRLSFAANDPFQFSTVKYERGTSYPFSRGFSFTISPTF